MANRFIKTTKVECPECGTDAAIDAPDEVDEHGSRLVWCVPDKPNDGDYCGHVDYVDEP